MQLRMARVKICWMPARRLCLEHDGCDAAKIIDAPRCVAEAQAWVTLCRPHDVRLIIIEDVIPARTDGVYLGEADADVTTACAALGPAAIIRESCYDALDRARATARVGASQVAFGAFSPRRRNRTRRARRLICRDKRLARWATASGRRHHRRQWRLPDRGWRRLPGGDLGGVYRRHPHRRATFYRPFSRASRATP